MLARSASMLRQCAPSTWTGLLARLGARSPVDLKPARAVRLGGYLARDHKRHMLGRDQIKKLTVEARQWPLPNPELKHRD